MFFFWKTGSARPSISVADRERLEAALDDKLEKKKAELKRLQEECSDIRANRNVLQASLEETRTNLELEKKRFEALSELIPRNTPPPVQHAFMKFC
jgi:chromosome segregation ATPase